MNKQLRIVLQIALGVIAVVLALFIYRGIMKPVRFNQEKDQRAAVVVQRLKDIRTVQEAYKKAYGHFISDIDSIVLFLQDGELPYTRMIGTVPDSLTEEEAIKLKIVSRETFTENAYNVLFPSETDKAGHLARLAYVPYTQQTEKIDLQAGFIEKNGYHVPVFEAKVPFELFLNGMDEQLIRNTVSQANDLNRYPGVKVGSMEEAITDGNWE
ncbi:MAG: hypothetical protein K2O53_07845 [Bacteroidales bacterium]|nr:hypothetical protein [Bacteroidales bacterium]